MHLPNGAQIFIEAERGSEQVMAIQKMETAGNGLIKMTLASTDQNKFAGIAQKDIIVVKNCNWDKLTDRVVRVVSKSDSDKSFIVEGVDVSDRNQFPGTATGSVARIVKWHEIPCVQDLSQDGGEQQFYTYQCLSDDQEQQVPTYKSAVSITYTFAHDFENPIYPILRQYDQLGEPAVMYMYIPKAQEMRLWSGVLSFNDIPKTTINEMETVSLSCSLRGRFTFVHSEHLSSVSGVPGG